MANWVRTVPYYIQVMTEIGFELLGDVKFHSESDLTNEEGELMCNIGQMTFIWPRNSEPEIFDSVR